VRPRRGNRGRLPRRRGVCSVVPAYGGHSCAERVIERPFASVRVILAREREQGRSFAEAWGVALASMQDAEARTIRPSTGEIWQDACEREPAKKAALVQHRGSDVVRRYRSRCEMLHWRVWIYHQT